MEKLSKKDYPLVKQEGDKKIILPGYPTYPESEDFYSQEKEEKEIDPEETAKLKGVITSDDGLDVPGSELDDEAEKTGDEDEENNYYSLSDDNQ